MLKYLFDLFEQVAPFGRELIGLAPGGLAGLLLLLLDVADLLAPLQQTQLDAGQLLVQLFPLGLAVSHALHQAKLQIFERLLQNKQSSIDDDVFQS